MASAQFIKTNQQNSVQSKGYVVYALLHSLPAFLIALGGTALITIVSYKTIETPRRDAAELLYSIGNTGFLCVMLSMGLSLSLYHFSFRHGWLKYEKKLFDAQSQNGLFWTHYLLGAVQALVGAGLICLLQYALLLSSGLRMNVTGVDFLTVCFKIVVGTLVYYTFNVMLAAAGTRWQDRFASMAGYVALLFGGFIAVEAFLSDRTFANTAAINAFAWMQNIYALPSPVMATALTGSYDYYTRTISYSWQPLFFLASVVLLAAYLLYARRVFLRRDLAAQGESREWIIYLPLLFLALLAVFLGFSALRGGWIWMVLGVAVLFVSFLLLQRKNIKRTIVQFAAVLLASFLFFIGMAAAFSLTGAFGLNSSFVAETATIQIDYSISRIDGEAVIQYGQGRIGRQVTGTMYGGLSDVPSEAAAVLMEERVVAEGEEQAFSELYAMLAAIHKLQNEQQVKSLSGIAGLPGEYQIRVSLVTLRNTEDVQTQNNYYTFIVGEAELLPIVVLLNAFGKDIPMDLV